MADDPQPQDVEDHVMAVECPCLPVSNRCDCGGILGWQHNVDKARVRKADGGHP